MENGKKGKENGERGRKERERERGRSKKDSLRNVGRTDACTNPWTLG